jgi:hypothetical protein
MILVDAWCFWIPYNQPKLYTAGKIIWGGSFRIGMLEVEGDVIDIVTVGKEKNAPTDVSKGCPTIFSSILNVAYQG